ncbi:MAG: DegT/DnrJ/EryC1/StrS aminotransferase family protein [Candidatus Omnitrophica bacterium]|nr:DegT/DnrJ/EryC1/StrS aminotransferase family protein [Candidatus Omnitrophota bacterium]
MNVAKLYTDFIEHSKPTIGKEELEAIENVIKSNYLSEGQCVKRFEEETADYIGSMGAVATCTGTLALHLALLSLGVSKNDEVVLPSYVCRSALNGVLYSGARPVLCDVNIEDFNISFNEALKVISKKTKAIIIPHMFGCPAEIDKFKNLGIYIIEDCAHSIGAEYQGRKVGNWGDLSIFSFEGTKYIVTGEGGMVLANSAPLLKRLRKLKEPDSLDYGVKYTYRMTDLQAAIGRIQLSKIDRFIKARRKIANIYNDNFANLDVVLPLEKPDSLHVFHRYMIKIKNDIDTFMEKCCKKMVKIKQPVKPYPLHRYLNLSGKRFPNTEYIMKRAVSVPIYPLLTEKDLKYITETVKKEL